jgi:hypothetical protein
VPEMWGENKTHDCRPELLIFIFIIVQAKKIPLRF